MEITKILIGIDNSKYAEHAAQYGFDLARKLNVSVGVVTIVEPMPATINPVADTTFGMPFDSTPDYASTEIMNVQNDAAHNTINTTIEKYGNGLQVTQFTEFGTSAEGILNCCAEYGADLIVIGTHHRSGFDKLFMGSVAEDVVGNAKVPVLVVPLIEEN